MKATIYANYGVLASEYRVIYTTNNPHARATCSERITIDLPDAYRPYITADDSIALMICGTPYLLSEVLSSYNDSPSIAWIDASGRHIERLIVVKEAQND